MHSGDECNYLPHKSIRFRIEDEENNVVLVLLFQRLSINRKPLQNGFLERPLMRHIA